MVLRIGVGVTREWVEEAAPLLEQAGLRLVRQFSPPEAEGEYVECDFDGGDDPIDATVLFDRVAQVRAVVARSMVPGLTVRFVPDGGGA